MPCKTNPLGVKGIGESGTIGAPPTIINAVIDALKPLGVEQIDMPATPRGSGRRSSGRSRAGQRRFAALLFVRWGSGPRFEDHVERRLGRAAEPREAALAHDLANPLLAGLRAKRAPTSWFSEAGTQTLVEKA